MKIYDFLWLFPFLFFSLGYFFVHSFFSVNQVELPNVIGKGLVEGAAVLSRHGLNLSLLKEKEEVDIAPGIILDQIPKSGNIRPRHSIKVVVSKKPELKKAPDLIGSSESELKHLAKQQQIKIKGVNVSSKYPLGRCFAQSPGPKEAIASDIVAYVSAGDSRVVVIPNLKGTGILDSKNMFEKSGTTVSIYHTEDIHPGHNCNKCRVLEQKPMAGSIVDLDKKVQVQLLAG